jgi:hypothetical protein
MAAGESASRRQNIGRQQSESYALPTANGGLYGKPLKISAAETRMNAASAPVDSARFQLPADVLPKPVTRLATLK